MRFTEKLLRDERVIKIHNDYLKHPFVKGLESGDLDKEKFKHYLIQDSLYLKDYGKVYAGAFLLSDNIKDLQFLHSCIGVVLSEETNMHTQYLLDYGLDVYKVDNLEFEKENREYLDYMLGFVPGGDIKEIFVSALSCTLTYEFIGKSLKKVCGDNIKKNYYGKWIEAYAGEAFEEFSVNSVELIDRLCVDSSHEEVCKLIEIYINACEHEMKFWDMSWRGRNYV